MVEITGIQIERINLPSRVSLPEFKRMSSHLEELAEKRFVDRDLERKGKLPPLNIVARRISADLTCAPPRYLIEDGFTDEEGRDFAIKHERTYHETKYPDETYVLRLVLHKH